jgi:small-conductance mechanosensitive channel
LGSIVWALLFFLLALLLSLIIRRWSHGLTKRAERLHLDPTAISYVAQLMQVGGFLVAGILYAHVIPALRSLGTALLASASVVSIVLGLAAQNTLGNSIAGMALLLYHPFRLGDEIQISAPTGVERGVVEAFTLGHTILLTPDGRQIIVPNSVMISSIFIKTVQ